MSEDVLTAAQERRSNYGTLGKVLISQNIGKLYPPKWHWAICSRNDEKHLVVGPDSMAGIPGYYPLLDIYVLPRV